MQPKPFLIAAAILVTMFAIAAAWWLAHSTGHVTVWKIQHMMAVIRENPWAPVMVIAIFLVAGAVAFPINLVVLATAAVFGPWLGYLYALVGCFGSAFLMFFVGAHVGRETLERQFGPRMQRVLQAIRKRGLLVVIGFRVVPVVPATLVNMAAGASGIRLSDFALGSLLGMGPGLLLVCIMGDRLFSLLTEPSIEEAVVLAACVGAYFVVVYASHALVVRRR